MPKQKRVYTEMIRLRVSPAQKKWMEDKALEQSERLEKTVSPAAVMRALINMQMDAERERGKVWDG